MTRIDDLEGYETVYGCQYCDFDSIDFYKVTRHMEKNHSCEMEETGCYYPYIKCNRPKLPS